MAELLAMQSRGKALEKLVRVLYNYSGGLK